MLKIIFKLTVVIPFVIGASIKGISQNFDSVQIFALSMTATYRIKIDKDLIKNEVDPLVLSDKKKIEKIYRLLVDTVKGNSIKKLKSNYLDIRLAFEFFYSGKSVQIIAITPHNTMFVDHTLYNYDRHKLKYLDRYIEGLGKKIGIN